MRSDHLIQKCHTWASGLPTVARGESVVIGFFMQGVLESVADRQDRKPYQVQKVSEGKTVMENP